MQEVTYHGWDAVELPLTDDQTRCSVENPLELPHVDAIQSSEDSVTIVYATNDHRALTRAVTVSVVTVPLIEGSYLRQWKQRPAIRLTWSANVSCWSMVTPRQVTVRRSTADPLTTRTDVSILANRSLRQILEVNCVFRCKASVCLTTSMQWPTSSIHDIKRSKIASRLSDDECSYNWVSLAYEWPVTPWRAAMTSKSAVYRRNRTVEQVPCDTSYR